MAACTAAITPAKNRRRLLAPLDELLGSDSLMFPKDVRTFRFRSLRRLVQARL